MKKILSFVILFSLCLCVCVYTVFGFTFPSQSVISTEMGDLSVGLKSKDEVREKVINLIDNFVFNLKSIDGKVHEIHLSDVVKNINYDGLFEEIDNISVFEKLKNREQKIDIIDYINFDEEKILSNLNSFNKSKIESVSAYLLYEDGEYKIVPEVQGNVYVEDVVDRVQNELSVLNPIVIDLFELGCYISPEVYRNDKDLNLDLNEFNSFKDVHLRYSVEDKEENLSFSNFHEWLIPQYNGKNLNRVSPFELDENKVVEYVDTLDSTYTTVGKSRVFVTSTGSTVDVKSPNYDWILDKEGMIEDISSHIEKKESVDSEMLFSKRGDVFGPEDYNGNYIEISIDNQHIWMYKDSKLLVDSAIVTGNVSHGNSTPKGIYFLTRKMRNVYLTGPTWRSYVSYWMPFIGNSIGLHDATWRNTFGGNIYKTNGSHGCVNLPTNTAKIIYENITKDMPIIIW